MQNYTLCDFNMTIRVDRWSSLGQFMDGSNYLHENMNRLQLCIVLI